MARRPVAGRGTRRLTTASFPTLWDRSPKCPYPTTPRRESRSNTNHDEAAALLVAADAGLKFPPSFRLIVRPREDTAKP